MRAKDSIDVDLKRLNLRVEYYDSLLDRYRSVFPRGSSTGAGAHELAINIRGAEIISSPNPIYIPLPISFYEHLIAETGLSPVFVGQIEDDMYSRALRERFPHARFVNHGFGLGDFHFIRASHNIVPAISTYSWLASWLSESAQRIFLPAAGHYHPVTRSDCDLLPRGDGRYSFYATDLETWKGTPAELQKLIHAPMEAFGFRPGAPDAFWPGFRRAPINAALNLARRNILALHWSPLPRFSSKHPDRARAAESDR